MQDGVVVGQAGACETPFVAGDSGADTSPSHAREAVVMLTQRVLT